MDYFALLSAAKNMWHRMSKVLVDEELGDIREEAAMAYFEVIYWNLSGETEKP